MVQPSFAALLSTLVCAAGLSVACTSPAEQEAARKTRLQTEAQSFLDGYTAEYLKLYYASNLAEWDSNTHIVEGDDTNRQRTEAANQALAAFTGAQATIDKTRELLTHEADLTALQTRQLNEILYKAANFPETVPELVKRRIAAEAAQSEKLFGFDFKVDGESLSANDIDDRLASSTDPAERRKVWEASKEVGKGLKQGLTELVELRNGTVEALGYPDFFAYQVSDYGMSTDEMMALNHRFVEELWPLYRELHTWARYELARRYGTEVPTLLPAHWLPNRWGQDWSELVDVEGLDLDGALADKTPEWVVQQGEAFYVSLGFNPLPQSFWERSSLYPVAADAGHKKNNHASAWHLDLQDDVRSLMSVQANARWWDTVHHELGHVYYYQSYTRPEVPPLLRGGANRGFHEAVGTLMGMASMQKPFLTERGLIAADTPSDEIRALLKEALDKVVFIPFSAGTMTHFEHDLYTGLAPDEYNQRWWRYVSGFQGIEPPAERGEESCDAATKTHVNDDPAQYYDYAISGILLYQLHAHVAEKILGQDPRQTNYWGRKDVGTFLAGILELGATEDWRQIMREKLGEELSAKPMLAYFEPLMAYLVEQNAGRVHTLPERPEV
ncbi:MAG: M2 family metallopeptidase [Thermoanaerobaculia bacterium]|nr:M2 family metallopeptidase [Thermoanaerobaculia bacterium]